MAISVNITADTSEFSRAISKAAHDTQKFDRLNNAAAKTFQELSRVTDKQANTYRSLVNKIQDVESSTSSLSSKQKQLRATGEKLRNLYSELRDKETTEANTLKKLIKQIDKQADSYNKLYNAAKKVKNSTISKKDSELFKGVGDSIKEFSSLASAFNSGGLVSALGNLAGPLSVVTVAFAGLNEVIKNNETLLDRWQGVTSGAGNAWKNFMRTFNFSTIGASFTAGQIFYDASDALESYRALNASFLGSILDDTQKAKTDKSEGKPWSKEQIGNLKKQINDYYDQEIKMIQETATAKKNTILSGLKGSELKSAQNFFTEFVEADNKYVVLEEYKRKYKQAKTQAEDIEKKYAYKTYTGLNGMTYQALDPLAVQNLMINNPLYASAKQLINGYGFLINSESDLNEFVKLLNDEKKSSQEQKRLIKEVNEAVAKSKNKEEIEKDIKKLHERNAILKKEIEEAHTLLRGDKESIKKVDLTKLQKNIKEVEDNRKVMANLYSTFESSPVADYWKLVTDFDNAILKGPDEMETALRGLQNRVNEYVKKYAELGYSVDNLWELIEESRDISNIYGGTSLNKQPIGLYELKRGWDIYSLSKKDELDKKNLRHRNKIIESLQKQGIRPYPAFVFDDYKTNYKTETKNSKKEQEDRIKLLEIETNAVNTLASAYSNVFDVINQISDGDDKINAWLQGILTGVQEGAKAWVEMSKIQLAASEAVALGKANASAAGLPFPYNLAAMATVTAAVLSTFSSFYTNFKGFANGGIVGGSSLGGDQMIARVNSGEMILNGSQQKKLFNLLNGNGTNTSTSIPEIKVRIAGSDLVGVLDNYGKKLNRVR